MGEKVKAFGKLPQILTFPFKGEGWFGKMAIAALILLAGGIIPILPTIILLGYFYEMVHRIVIEKKDPELPKWDNWGEFLSNGFKWFLSTLIIAIPFTIVLLVGMALLIVPIFFLAEGGNEGLFASYYVLIFFVQFILMFISLIFMVFMAVFAPVYMTHIVAKGELKAMFQIKEWWKIFVKGFWEFFISFLLLFGIGMILYWIYYVVAASVICCCLSPFVLGFAGVYAQAVYMALVSSSYAEGRDKMPEEDAPKLLDEGPAAVEPEALPEPEPIEAPEPVEEPEEFDLPSPDGEEFEEAVDVAPDATMIEVEEVEEVVAPAAEATMVSMEMPEVEFPNTTPVEEALASEDVPSEDATVVGEVNNDVAAALGFAEATVRMDDLKKISGVGPKTADILKQNGIMTFAQLADMNVDRLKEILLANGLDVVAATCDDWPQQARDLL